MKQIRYTLIGLLLLSIFYFYMLQGHLSNMYLQKAHLTKEEKGMVDLLDSHEAYMTYDFKLNDKVQTLQVNTYKLDNGKWTKIYGGGGYSFNDKKGRLLLAFENLGIGLKIGIQSKNTNILNNHSITTPEAYKDMDYITSFLSDRTTIEYNKEIPLAIQIITNSQAISSYNVDSFFNPELYEKYNYDYIYAITLMFSEKTITELDNLELEGVVYNAD